MAKAKRYLHSNNGSKLVEDNSEEMQTLIESGEWFKNKADVENPTTGEAPEEDSTPIAELDDDDLVSLYDEVDAEMVKRGLLDEAEEPILYENMTDEALKEVAKELKIPGFGSMKHDTLIKAILGATKC